MFDSHYISGEIFQTHWQPSLLSSNKLSWEGTSYNQLVVIDFRVCSLPCNIPNDAFFYLGWWKWPCLCSPNGKFHSQSWSHAGLLLRNIFYLIKLIYFVDDFLLQELQSFTVTFRSEEVKSNKNNWWLGQESFLISCSVQEEKKHNFVTDSARSVSQWVEVPTRAKRSWE